MELELVKLTTDHRDRKYFEMINDEAFPASERMTFDDIFAMTSGMDADVLGIYTNAAAAGFAVILKNEECGYINYLAMDSNIRGKGYGSAALKKIIENYPGIQLTLDFEIIDESAENISQRIMRKEFYLVNGFHETGYYTMLRDNKFELVCTGGELRKEALAELLRVIHTYQPDFQPELLR